MFFFNRHTSEQTARAVLYRKIAVTFFSISVLVALGVFYVSFSWATIRVIPIPKGFSDQFELTVADSTAGVPPAGSISGKVIQQELEGEGTFSASTGKTIQGKTSGSITVVNKSATSQKLRATTRFISANDILFRSVQFVEVPAGGQVDVAVIADKEGDLGEIDTSRFILPGLAEGRQSQIYGITFAQQQSGIQDVKILSADDIAKGQDDLRKKLEEKFLGLLDAEKLKVDAPSVGAAIYSQVVGTSANHAVGDQTQDVIIKAKIRFTAVLYDKRMVQEKIVTLLSQNISMGYELINPRDEDITGTVKKVDPTSSTATIIFQVLAGKIRTTDLALYHKKDLAGLSKDDIIAYFKGYDDIKDVSVSFYPFWVMRAPLLIDHISIVVSK